jgi:hypothetical protein
MTTALPYAFEWKEIVRRGGLKDIFGNCLQAPVFVFQLVDLHALYDKMRDRWYPDWVRLPVNPCLFEVQGGDHTWLLPCTRTIDGAYSEFFMRQDGHWSPTKIAVECTTPEAGVEVYWKDDDDLEDEARTAIETSAVCMFRACFMALAANPTTASTRPSQSQRHNVSKRPEKLGWEYRIVEVHGLVRPSGPSLGGTHASPKWHLRRGHWRRYPGKDPVWIRETEVGSQEQGGVIHDYIVKPQGTDP